MDKAKVCIVVLNWNKLKLTKACLKSISEQSFKSYTVIVVDNGSVDGSKNWLRAQNDIDMISNKKNLGFARAINQGFKRAIDNKSKYIISLNNDTELAPNWLEKLVNFMEHNPDIDFAQGSSMQKEDVNVFDSTGIYIEKGFIPNQRALGKKEPSLDITAIGPNAAGSIYRRVMLINNEVRPGEYFDNRFFAYVEDVDFNLRASLRGYKFGFVQSAKLYHIGSATGNLIEKKKMFWGSRNLVWLIVKNVPLSLFMKNFKIIIKSHLANLQFLWVNQRKNFASYLLGLFVGILTMPFFLQKRRNNMKKMKLTINQFSDLLIDSNPPLTNPLKKLLDMVK